MDDMEENLKPYEHDVNGALKTLNDICNWHYLDDIAIEYHDLERIAFITYAELCAAKQKVFDILLGIKEFQFIGVNFDIPQYCVPSLLLGITASKHGFANLPVEPVVREKLLVSLCMQYLFVRYGSIEGDIIHQFTIHNERIYLVKLKHVEKKDIKVKQNCYAYAIATSGTTGVPKIVRVPHFCIVSNVLDLRRILVATKSDKIAQFTNFTFDPSIIEVFLALSVGGILFMVSKVLKDDPNRLLQKTYSNLITMLQITPSLFLHNWSKECLKTTILSENSSLRVLLLGGEPFPKAQLLLEAKHPKNSTRIYNIYGITEVSCWASINEMSDISLASDTHCLGKPLSHTVFQVKNEAGEIVTKGRGFLYIGSSDRFCVIDDEDVEELVRPVFRDSGDLVDIDEYGRIFYNGRRNSIVKRFGNKVDLIQLENAVSELCFVANSYALWDENSHKLYLCLATTNKISEHPDMKCEVIKHLHKLQPLYRPDEIHFIDHFKFTSSGKICTQFLIKQCTENKTVNRDLKVDFQDIESIAKSIWKDNLKREDDGFRNLGGTSVIALQMTNALSIAFNMEFPELIGMFLRNATFTEYLGYLKHMVLSIREKGPAENSKRVQIDEKQSVSSINVTGEQEFLAGNQLVLPKQESVYQWHKCRGQMYGGITNINQGLNLQSKRISSIQMIRTYDLHKCVDASPTVFRYADGQIFATVGSHSGFICTVDLRNNSGTSYKVKLPDRIEASVLILDDFRGIVGCYDGHVYCLHLKNGEIIWKFRTADVVKCSAIFCKRRRNIFVGSYDCHVYCLSGEDGSEIWRVKASTGSVTASGALHPKSDTVLFGTLDGTCLALQESSGKIIWKRNLGDPVFVAPLTLSSGLVLFCSVTGTLYCFDIDANVEMWKYEVNGNIFSYIVTQVNPTTKLESIILASQNKNVYLLEAKDSSFKTEPISKRIANFHSPIFATPWCETDRLLVTCTDGTLSIYNLSENKLLTSTKLPGDVFSSPVVNDDLIVVGCRDNNMYVLKLT